MAQLTPFYMKKKIENCKNRGLEKNRITEGDLTDTYRQKNS